MMTAIHSDSKSDNPSGSGGRRYGLENTELRDFPEGSEVRAPSWVSWVVHFRETPVGEPLVCRAATVLDGPSLPAGASRAAACEAGLEFFGMKRVTNQSPDRRPLGGVDQP
jgi:hypothetical protein